MGLFALFPALRANDWNTSSETEAKMGAVLAKRSWITSNRSLVRTRNAKQEEVSIAISVDTKTKPSLKNKTKTITVHLYVAMQILSWRTGFLFLLLVSNAHTWLLTVKGLEGTVLVTRFSLQPCLASIKYFQMPEQGQSKRVPLQLMSAKHSLQCTWKWVSNILKRAHDPALGKRSIKDVLKYLPALFWVYNTHQWGKACAEQYLFLTYHGPLPLLLWKLLLDSWILLPLQPSKLYLPIPLFPSSFLS